MTILPDRCQSWIFLWDYFFRLHFMYIQQKFATCGDWSAPLGRSYDKVRKEVWSLGFIYCLSNIPFGVHDRISCYSSFSRIYLHNNLLYFHEYDLCSAWMNMICTLQGWIRSVLCMNEYYLYSAWMNMICTHEWIWYV